MDNAAPSQFCQLRSAGLSLPLRRIVLASQQSFPSRWIMHAVFELEEVSSRPPLACQPGLIRISCTEEKRILIYCNILHASAVRQQRSKICPVVTDCLLCPQNLPKAAQNNHSAGRIAVETSRSCGAVARATTLGVEFRAFTFITCVYFWT